MDTGTIELFCQQLANWAETTIEKGRYPFRKVETFPSILTEIGEVRPSLVFWINRDSFMAGGVLLLPPKEAEEVVEAGRQCARALGLRHFVTWAAREIVFWEDSETAVTRQKTLPLKASGHNAAEDFHSALTTVMAELKVLSVLGAVAPQQLSPYCLANLCFNSLVTILPSIEESYRLARSDRRLETKKSVATLAKAKGVLSLLRLLTLCFLDRLPNTIQSEGLERAMLFALDTLSKTLRTPLQLTGDEVALPTESAICLHHLLRRLTQLQCAKDRHRAAQIVGILRSCLVGQLGGLPIPFAPEPTIGTTLVINPDRPGLTPPPSIEVASPPLLALFALLRELDSAPPVMQIADPFELTPAPLLTSVIGSLTDESIPDEADRRVLTAHLRLSWPTRRLALPPRSPNWAWTFVHLLGLVEKDARIAIRIPADWLAAAYGKRLQQLIAEECVLDFIGRDATGGLQLQLRRGQDPTAVSTLLGPEGPRLLPWPQIAGLPRSFFRLALELPEDLFRLLQEQALWFHDAEHWPEKFEHTVFHFTRSVLGSRLWALVSGGQVLPERTSLRADVLRYGLPLPSDGILAELARSSGDETEKNTQAVFDSELMRLLGIKRALEPIAMRKSRSRSKEESVDKKPSNDELAAQIITKACVDGLPRFPEQYLYDYYRPALQEYSFTGPLQFGDEFFDRFYLRDQANRTLEVVGRDAARALLIASYGNSAHVALPVETELVTAILSRYLTDLRQLRRELIRQCHVHIAESRAADNMVEKIWQSLQLPPWALVDA